MKTKSDSMLDIILSMSVEDAELSLGDINKLSLDSAPVEWGAKREDKALNIEESFLLAHRFIMSQLMASNRVRRGIVKKEVMWGTKASGNLRNYAFPIGVKYFYVELDRDRELPSFQEEVASFRLDFEEVATQRNGKKVEPKLGHINIEFARGLRIEPYMIYNEKNAPTGLPYDLAESVKIQMQLAIEMLANPKHAAIFLNEAPTMDTKMTQDFLSFLVEEAPGVKSFNLSKINPRRHAAIAFCVNALKTIRNPDEPNSPDENKRIAYIANKLFHYLGLRITETSGKSEERWGNMVNAVVERQQGSDEKVCPIQALAARIAESLLGLQEDDQLCILGATQPVDFKELQRWPLPCTEEVSVLRSGGFFGRENEAARQISGVALEAAV